MTDKMLMEAVAYETLRAANNNPRAGRLMVAEAIHNVEVACAEGQLHTLVRDGEKDFGDFDRPANMRSGW